MSLKSWKKEFYRKPANEVSRENALQHSLRKWIGLKPSNRKKHGVKLSQSDLVEIWDKTNIVFCIDSSSCALCQHFINIDDNCPGCPLVTSGGVCCACSESPYNLFLDKGAVAPMIRALEKTRREKCLL